MIFKIHIVHYFCNFVLNSNMVNFFHVHILCILIHLGTLYLFIYKLQFEIQFF